MDNKYKWWQDVCWFVGHCWWNAGGLLGTYSEHVNPICLFWNMFFTWMILLILNLIYVIILHVERHYIHMDTYKHADGHICTDQPRSLDRYSILYSRPFFSPPLCSSHVMFGLPVGPSLYTNAQRQRQLGFVLDIRKDKRVTSGPPVSQKILVWNQAFSCALSFTDSKKHEGISAKFPDRIMCVSSQRHGSFQFWVSKVVNNWTIEKPNGQTVFSCLKALEAEAKEGNKEAQWGTKTSWQQNH